MFKTLKKSYLPSLCGAVIVLSLAVVPGQSFAQEPSSNAPPTRTQEAGPKLRKLEEYTESLLKGLEAHEAHYLYQIRQEFSVLRSIQVVQKDIENAINSCSDENPAMKDQMESRFADWKDAILPKLAVTDAALGDAIRRQSFRPTVRVNMLLDHVQAAFTERDESFKKVPVTTEEACKSLLQSMDNTEENLTSILGETVENLKTLPLEPKEAEGAADADTADTTAGS